MSIDWIYVLSRSFWNPKLHKYYTQFIGIKKGE